MIEGQHSISSLRDDNLFCYYLVSDFSYMQYTVDMSDLSVVVYNQQVCPM